MSMYSALLLMSMYVYEFVRHSHKHALKYSLILIQQNLTNFFLILGHKLKTKIQTKFGGHFSSKFTPNFKNLLNFGYTNLIRFYNFSLDILSLGQATIVGPNKSIKIIVVFSIWIVLGSEEELSDYEEDKEKYNDDDDNEKEEEIFNTV